jgi:hypothetical protein
MLPADYHVLDPDFPDRNVSDLFATELDRFRVSVQHLSTIKPDQVAITKHEEALRAVQEFAKLKGHLDERLEHIDQLWKLYAYWHLEHVKPSANPEQHKLWIQNLRVRLHSARV